MLTGVTLTGADDAVEPTALHALQAEFPFVEFGILWGSKYSAPRFPIVDWIDRLHGLDLKLALHLCGEPLRRVIAGEGFPWPEHPRRQLFSRVQLNFHGHYVAPEGRHEIRAAAGRCEWEIIVQLDGVNEWVLDLLCECPRSVKASGLYDVSHGSGTSPDEWPAPNPARKIGYAGGIGPDTICRDLEDIRHAAGSHDYWIDMETHLRNRQDAFDIERCRWVLEECARDLAPLLDRPGPSMMDGDRSAIR